MSKSTKKLETLYQDAYYSELWDPLQLWDYFRGVKGENVKIAVLDSGIQKDHPMFKGCAIEGKTFCKDSPWYEDTNGHGTHVAGIIVGQAYAYTNQSGYFQLLNPFSSPGELRHIYLGIAPNAHLFIGKIMINGKGNEAELIRGLRWAKEKKCDIISCSIGAKNTSDLFNIIQELAYEGRIVICGSANEGMKNSYNIMYPARYGNVICVGGHTNAFTVYPRTSTGRELEILAPAENIVSTYINSSYMLKSGTSMATPFVTALTALILSWDRKNRNLISTMLKMKKVLVAMTASPNNHDEVMGYGVLNPVKFLKDGPDKIYDTLLE